MSHLAHAQVSRMSNKQPESDLNKDQLSNGARSGSAGCDVQRFRQETTKSYSERSSWTSHVSEVSSLETEMGWNGTSAPTVWMELPFITISCFLSFCTWGVEQGAVDWNLSTDGSMNCSFVLCELPWPWKEFRSSWYKKGRRSHRQNNRICPQRPITE